MSERAFENLFQLASDEARRLQHGHVGVEHLFLVLVGRPDGRAQRLLRLAGLDPVRVVEELGREVGTGPAAPKVPEPTPRLQAIAAAAVASVSNPASLDEAIWLRALFQEGRSLPVRYLSWAGLSAERALLLLAEGGAADDQTRARVAFAPGFRVERAPSSVTELSDQAAVERTRLVSPTEHPISAPTPALDSYGRDLTNLARLGRLAEALGRENEIEQLVTILVRTQKSNPLLLGDAGVGTTAIVEGLAWRVANGRVPEALVGKRIVEVNVSDLVSGTPLRGQFEERIQQLLKEATHAPEVILFIDELHRLVGAGGGTSDGNEAAQMFKLALTRGEIACIGATTQDEYSKHIGRDPVLERRFSVVTIRELSPEGTLAVLEAVAVRILEKQASQKRRLRLAPDTLRAAVAMTERFVKDRRQPDKSIDAVDISCARAVVRGRDVVEVSDIASVIAEWTGLPAAQLTTEEEHRYANMEDVLGKRVIGQPEAVKAVSRSIRAAVAGLKQPNRPIGVFLFAGPSGVGKTKLARDLATFLFGTPDALVRFDMGQFQEEHTVSSLIGSPMGYLGSDSGGQFTEALRRRPFSVVLLDEIEKAHPAIQNIFLGVFDDGRISDNRGRVVDCSHALFILTCNVEGSRIVGTPSDEIRQLAADFMRPEMMNRITAAIGFAPLGRSELAPILDQIVAQKIEGLRQSRGIDVILEPSVKDFLLDRGFYAPMGARPLERVVEHEIVQPLVDRMFAGTIGPGMWRVTLKGDQIEFLSTLAGDATEQGEQRDT